MPASPGSRGPPPGARARGASPAPRAAPPPAPAVRAPSLAGDHRPALECLHAVAEVGQLGQRADALARDLDAPCAAREGGGDRTRLLSPEPALHLGERREAAPVGLQPILRLQRL